MKTKSIKFIAALLGAAAILQVSVLAGPGWQTQIQTRKVSKEKDVATTSIQVRKAPTAAKTVIKPGPSLTHVSGPRGGAYAYRW
jgi:hypothetical protein